MNSFLTIPNLLSVSRIIISLILWDIFFFQKHFSFYDVLWLVVVAYFTDFLDGFIARTFNQKTEVGKILDPIGDKLLTAILFLFLAREKLISTWLFFVVITKDILTLTAGLYLVKVRNIIPESNIFGKITTFLVAITVALAISQTAGIVKLSSTYFTFLQYLILAFSILTITSYGLRYFFTDT